MYQLLVDLHHAILSTLANDVFPCDQEINKLNKSSLTSIQWSVLERVCQQNKNCSVLVYGSVARGTHDDQSDIDVFLVNPNRFAKSYHHRMMIDGVMIDVMTSGSVAIKKSFRTRRADNNNFILTAFYEGVTVRDLGRQIELLKHQARQIYQAGPQTLENNERSFLTGELRQRIAQVKNASMRSQKSLDACFLSRLRADQLVVRSIYIALCHRRKWTTSFKNTLAICIEELPELYSFYEDYIARANQTSSFDKACEMAGQVIDLLQTKTESAL